MALATFWNRGATTMTTDTALIARCQKADIVAFNEIVGRYKGKIYNYLYRMTGNAEDAEDLTQEVFVRMYSHIHTFRAEASLSTWLFRIAGNLCVDAFRRKKKERGVVSSLDAPLYNDEEDGGATRDVPDIKAAPEILFSRKELGGQIEEALAKLPAKLRSAVVLHDIEGLSYEEIAEVEKIPLGTVKSRIFNARVALRSALRPYLES
ncbi:sigma-70 family RNA polymerase sigma factor [Armatimonas sp.]|uniref:sigma-70 family RNA polymerase sigma factor n=1 Tax=Armatimonas sp. TaxID=1872638 RepID=UPI00286B5E1C|nr:sigma-70 family RNA polymerase sigma factor [Armatimonas sp.]